MQLRRTKVNYEFFCLKYKFIKAIFDQNIILVLHSIFFKEAHISKAGRHVRKILIIPRGIITLTTHQLIRAADLVINVRMAVQLLDLFWISLVACSAVVV